jgi:hypothetical protein
MHITHESSVVKVPRPNKIKAIKTGRNFLLGSGTTFGRPGIFAGTGLEGKLFQ